MALERAYIKACGKVAELKKLRREHMRGNVDSGFDPDRLDFWECRKSALASDLGL